MSGYVQTGHSVICSHETNLVRHFSVLIKRPIRDVEKKYEILTSEAGQEQLTLFSRQAPITLSGSTWRQNDETDEGLKEEPEVSSDDEQICSAA